MWSVNAKKKVENVKKELRKEKQIKGGGWINT